VKAKHAFALSVIYERHESTTFIQFIALLRNKYFPSFCSIVNPSEPFTERWRNTALHKKMHLTSNFSLVKDSI